MPLKNVFDIYPPLFHFDGYENNSGQWNNIFRQVPRNPPSGPMIGGGKGKRRGPMAKTHLEPRYYVFTDGFENATEVEEMKDYDSSYDNLSQLKKFYQDGLIDENEYKQEKAKILSNLF